MEIKQYAPVIIPTLNRYGHFKRCIDSLERCTGADKTDVYVGLDYPPSEKYVEGWEKIDAFLAEKEKHNRFKNLYVRRRDHNCGIGKVGSNIHLLRLEVEELYDTYIMSEDDNEFSPNFLEYINYGLMVYRNRKDVMAITGFLFPEVSYNKNANAYLSSFSNAYGTGYWTEKKFDFSKKGSKAFVDEVLSSWKLSWNLYKKRAASLNGMLSMHFRGIYYGDVLKTAELILKNRYSLFPAISKVRNWGHDGTGEHCSITNKYIKQAIDENKTFENPAITVTIDIAKKLDFSIFKRIAVIVRYIGFRLTGKDWFNFYWKNQ